MKQRLRGGKLRYGVQAGRICINVDRDECGVSVDHWCKGATLRVMEKVINQGLASPESGGCNSRFNRTPDPVQN